MTLDIQPVVKMPSSGLDAHLRPPDSMRALMKHWQRSTAEQINKACDIVDLGVDGLSKTDGVVPSTGPSIDLLRGAFSRFINTNIKNLPAEPRTTSHCFEVKSLPGLFIYPALLPHYVQIELLNKMLHRDLSNPEHKTNLNIHYDIPYSQVSKFSNTYQSARSFFEIDDAILLQPKDPSVHKTLIVRQMLDRKLRWMTLGGQYDWTAKVYPSEKPPGFPDDIGMLLKTIWPDTDAQAAIVNFYTPGDTLSVHRDVSEECDRGLISISIGCEALFIAGDEDGTHQVTIRLRSGDAIMMSGEARYAWHAVPKVLPNTCPKEIEAWPFRHNGMQYPAWTNWLNEKRINLNVRQMRLDT